MAEKSQYDSVLLPTASIDVFAASDETKDTLSVLTEDWRFARVQMNVDLQGIDAAIQKYSEHSSPDLVIIGTDDISEGFIAKLEELAGHCIEGTEAIVIGPENDVKLYRKLVGMGVRDYLVRPVSGEDISNVITKALFEKKGISQSRLITVLGAKGGVGTTSISQILAWSTAEDLGLKTFLMDASGGWSSMGVAFGKDPSASLAECIRHAAEGTDEDLQRMYTQVTDRLTLFSCGGDDLIRYAVDGDQYEKAVDRIMQTYPVVIVDLSFAPADVRRRMVERASDVVIVTTPALTALRSARSLLKEIKALRGEKQDVIDLIVNKKGKYGGKEIAEGDIETALNHAPQVVLPFKPELFAEVETQGKPLAKIKNGKGVTDQLKDVARHAANYHKDTPPKSKKDTSIISKLFSGLPGKG